MSIPSYLVKVQFAEVIWGFEDNFLFRIFKFLEYPVVNCFKTKTREINEQQFVEFFSFTVNELIESRACILSGRVEDCHLSLYGAMVKAAYRSGLYSVFALWVLDSVIYKT